MKKSGRIAITIGIGVTVALIIVVALKNRPEEEVLEPRSPQDFTGTEILVKPQTTAPKSRNHRAQKNAQIEKPYSVIPNMQEWREENGVFRREIYFRFQFAPERPVANARVKAWIVPVTSYPINAKASWLTTSTNKTDHAGVFVVTQHWKPLPDASFYLDNYQVEARIIR